MIPVRQGFMSMNPPSKAFEKAVLGGKIRHNKHPVLRWMMDCTAIKQDPAGNIKPVKPDRQKTNKRIDGIVATIMGIDRCMRHQEQTSVYANPETAVM
jgi:phage terminase large subunit-like protein